MIINKKQKKFKHLPDTLEGEVLLKEEKNNEGKIIAYHTASARVVRNMKNKSKNERKIAGWDKYEHIIEGVI